MTVRFRGLQETLFDSKYPALQAAWWLGGGLTLFSLVGTALLQVDSNEAVMSTRNARTAASLTVLLIITYNKKFGTMTLAFARASGSVIPTLVAILMVVMLFAAASMELFSDKVIDPSSKKPYFDNYATSLTTMFRMFNGNWHDTMWAAAEATTEGAQLWFTCYVFILAVFCCELFVGIVIAGYAEVQEIASPRLYWSLAPAFEECSSEQRGPLTDQLLKLARQMRPCNELHATMLGHIRDCEELQIDALVEPVSPSLEVAPEEDPPQRVNSKRVVGIQAKKKQEDNNSGPADWRKQEARLPQRLEPIKQSVLFGQKEPGDYVSPVEILKGWADSNAADETKTMAMLGSVLNQYPRFAATTFSEEVSNCTELPMAPALPALRVAATWPRPEFRSSAVVAPPLISPPPGPPMWPPLPPIPEFLNAVPTTMCEEHSDCDDLDSLIQELNGLPQLVAPTSTHTGAV